jgi:glucokinase
MRGEEMKILAADIGGTKSWLSLCEDNGVEAVPTVIHEHIYASADYDDFSSLLSHFIQTAERMGETDDVGDEGIDEQAENLESADVEKIKNAENAENNEQAREVDEVDNLEKAQQVIEEVAEETVEKAEKKEPLEIEVMCLALAGVIQQGHCSLTNLDWELDAVQLANDFSINKVVFVNDFQAAAMGVKTLKTDDFIPLNSAETQEGAVTVVTGAGTGLGIAWMQGSGAQLQLFDSEGGHIDFAPTTNQQIGLLQHLRRQYKHVSYERILSGDGLVQIYQFLTDNKNETVTAKKITEWTNQKVFVAEASMRLFIEIYAAYIGNLAMLYKPAGGIYIAGGIATHIVPWMRGKDFKKCYLDKGRMRGIAERTPVFLITNTRLGLQGAIHLAGQYI